MWCVCAVGCAGKKGGGKGGGGGGGEGEERSDGRAAASTYTSAGARACCARTTERVARTPAVWGMVRAPRDGSVVRGGGKWRTGGRNNHIAHLLAAHEVCNAYAAACGQQKEQYVTGDSQEITHPSTSPAQAGLSCEF